MNRRDHTQLLAHLSEEYRRHSPASAALQSRAEKHLVDGGSHALRLIEPFPPRIAAAQGAYIHDEDSHRILDFWQGHYANILGHNAEVITSTLARAFEERLGLQTGFTERTQVEVAEILCRQTKAEKVRFTTSGALATMYAVLLARAYTGRELVLKVGGGWHGGHPWGLKGVNFYAEDGFTRMETLGFPSVIGEQVLVTRFNDPDMLRDHFRQFGDRIACFIVEPFMGRGGFMPASLEYLQTARRLTERYGAALIFDEVISGFRFRAGDVAALYGVQPDLTTYGKVMGGGMPVAAVAGRAALLEQAGRAGESVVKFSGGTYSGHPASLLAAKTLLTYLVEHEDEIYPRIAALGEKTRQAVEAVFAEERIPARCTGYPNDVLPGSSLAMLHFPYDDGLELNSPDAVWDPDLCDVTLRDQVLQLALLLEDVHVVHGLGALSTAHTEADIAFLSEACQRAARRIKPYLHKFQGG